MRATTPNAPCGCQRTIDNTLRRRGTPTAQGPARCRRGAVEALMRCLEHPLLRGVIQIHMNELLNAMRIILTREMDRYAREYLARHPDAVVVHIGCGLDSRFERVDDGAVEW